MTVNLSSHKLLSPPISTEDLDRKIRLLPNIPRRNLHDFAAMLVQLSSRTNPGARSQPPTGWPWERGCNHPRGTPGTLARFTAVMALPKLKTVFSRETFHQTASLLFFHGEHLTAEQMKNILRCTIGRDFSFPHIRVIYPQAPHIPYTMSNEEPSSVWFDRNSYNPTTRDDRKSIDHSCSLIRQLVNDQKTRGVEPERIVLGGLGMGGVIAMHAAFRYVAWCVVLIQLCNWVISRTVTSSPTSVLKSFRPIVWSNSAHY